MYLWQLEYVHEQDALRQRQSPPRPVWNSLGYVQRELKMTLHITEN